MLAAAIWIGCACVWGRKVQAVGRERGGRGREGQTVAKRGVRDFLNTSRLELNLHCHIVGPSSVVVVVVVVVVAVLVLVPTGHRQCRHATLGTGSALISSLSFVDRWAPRLTVGASRGTVIVDHASRPGDLGDLAPELHRIDVSPSRTHLRRMCGGSAGRGGRYRLAQEVRGATSRLLGDR